MGRHTRDGPEDKKGALIRDRQHEPTETRRSHVQRDVVDWTLTEAAIRGGMRDVALEPAHERLNTRPRSAVNRQFPRRAEQIAA